MVNRFILNELSYFGPGARKELPSVVNRLGFKKALVVTDKGLIQFGVAKMVTDVLDEAGIPYEIYSEVKPNPTIKNVQMGVDAFKASGADFMVAIKDVCMSVVYSVRTEGIKISIRILYHIREEKYR